MIVGERMMAALKASGLSQSELARRVGVSQPTIYRAITGGQYGTRNLHRIARELGTTPAYLTGETDDPTADAPTAPELSFDERTLIDHVRAIRTSDRDAVFQVARSLSEPIKLPSEGALARMFEGMLEATPGVTGAELARELATLLPIALAQLEGPLIEMDQTAAFVAAANDRPAPRRASRT